VQHGVTDKPGFDRKLAALFDQYATRDGVVSMPLRVKLFWWHVNK